jgi:hypothetical protein
MSIAAPRDSVCGTAVDGASPGMLCLHATVARVRSTDAMTRFAITRDREHRAPGMRSTELSGGQHHELQQHPWQQQAAAISSATNHRQRTHLWKVKVDRGVAAPNATVNGAAGLGIPFSSALPDMERPSSMERSISTSLT